jgi:hypothetical protein
MIKSKKKFLITTMSALFFLVHFFWLAMILSSCRKIIDICEEGSDVEVRHSSGGDCYYRVDFRSWCDNSDTERLIKQGQEACEHAGTPCTESIWIADTTSHWNKVQGTCKK